MEVMPIIESLFRWIHVVAGVLWIGLLYFFNWVNANVMPKLDARDQEEARARADAARALLVPLGCGVHLGDRPLSPALPLLSSEAKT